MPASPPRAYYVTALDRLGLAVLAGGAMTGVLAMLLALAGEQRSPVKLVLIGAVGALVAMAGTITLAGPVWLACHRHNRRGPAMAATTAGLVALVLFTAVQLPGTDGEAYRWASALANAALAAILAAAIGAAMQRVAYRRLM